MKRKVISLLCIIVMLISFVVPTSVARAEPEVGLLLVLDEHKSTDLVKVIDVVYYGYTSIDAVQFRLPIDASLYDSIGFEWAEECSGINIINVRDGALTGTITDAIVAVYADFDTVTCTDNIIATITLTLKEELSTSVELQLEEIVMQGDNSETPATNIITEGVVLSAPTPVPGPIVTPTPEPTATPTPTPEPIIVVIPAPYVSVESGVVPYGTQVSISASNGHYGCLVNGESMGGYWGTTITITEDTTLTVWSYTSAMEEGVEYVIEKETYIYTVDPATIPTPTPIPTSGTIGDVSYSFEDGTLTISGEGSTGDVDVAPWAVYADEITEIVISDKVTEIGENLFAGCSSLVSLTIPKTVERIGKNALTGCTSLTTLRLPFTGTSADDTENVFACIFGESAKDIPESLKEVYVTRDKYIAANDFADAVNIEKIVIESEKETWNENVTEVEGIGSRAFYNCSSLKSLTIKSNKLINIADEICKGCNKLESMSVPFIGDMRSSNRTENSTFGYFFGSSDSLELGKNVVQEYTPSAKKYYYIPGSLKKIEITYEDGIPYGAFMNMNGVEVIDIYTSATIDGYAFYSCNGLTYAVLPTDLKELGERAFSNCGNLVAVRMPDNENNLEMGKYVFYNCYNLQRAIVLDNVSSISPDAFEGCSEVTIYGYSNTFAEQYASENKIDFVALNESYTEEEFDQIMRGEDPEKVTITCEKFTTSVGVTLSKARRGVIIAAMYDDAGRFVGIKTAETNDTATGYELKDVTGNVKVMLWKSIDSMEPLSDMWAE